MISLTSENLRGTDKAIEKQKIIELMPIIKKDKLSSKKIIE